MDRTLGEFFQVLRAAGVRVSTGESMEALAATQLVGIDSRARLKQALSMVLAKTKPEKQVYNRCFDQYFQEKNEDETPQSTSAFQEATGEGKGMGGIGGDGGTKAQSLLGQMLQEGNVERIDLAMAQAQREVGLNQIRMFTQIGRFSRRIMEAMGLLPLQEEINQLEQGNANQQALAQTLDHRRTMLRERVRDRVQHQLLLFAEKHHEEIMEKVMRRVRLSNLESHHFQHMRRLVQKMARRLASKHGRRRKRAKRGLLDVRRTLRGNIAYGGKLFHLHFKDRKVTRAEVLVLCDISGSVSSVSRFLLMFLYQMREVIPKLRAFVFSSHLGEVTDLFRENDLEEAMATAQARYGGGSTSYAQAFEDFADLCLSGIDRRTTVMILGDGRNNYGKPRHEILEEIYRKARAVYWLNPESRLSWHLGDSEMRRYTPHCTRAEECNSLAHLTRVVDQLMRTIS